MSARNETRCHVFSANLHMHKAGIQAGVYTSAHTRTHADVMTYPLPGPLATCTSANVLFSPICAINAR